MSDNRRDFNALAAGWDENPGRVRLAADVLSAIRGAVSPGLNMRALDFGCGTGLLTLGLAPFVGSVTGVDSSPGMLDVMRSKFKDLGIKNVDVMLLDLEQGDTLKGAFDLIVSSMTFHHVEEVVPVLTKLHGGLVSGGRICIADLEPDDGLFHGDNRGVMHFGFEREAMSRYLKESGFEVVSYVIASEVGRMMPDGETRVFRVFLMTGQKA